MSPTLATATRPLRSLFARSARGPLTPAPAASLVAALVVAALALSAGELRAAEVTVDGVDRVVKLPGEAVVMHVAGPPGAPAVLFLDTAPGPATASGAVIELGLSPALVHVPLGALPAGGSIVRTLRLPDDSSLVDLTLYAVVATLERGAWIPSTAASVVFRSRDVELAGRPLGGAVGFETIRALPAGEPLWAALDPLRVGDLGGLEVDLYVTASRDAAGWDADPTLVDVSDDGVQTVVLAGDLGADRFVLDGGGLSADAGDGFGVPYDVVVDVDRDGLLGPADLIDGYGDVAGVYAVRDPTLPGPHAVVEVLYSGGTFLGQDLYYPADIATMGELPLVIVSHGNGHDYQWYDHIGMHLASYGFVVMSHQNNTGPGINAASKTTLDNTDWFLANLDLIEGGALLGHVDRHRIAWIGHSRGGEGVARSVDRILNDGWEVQEFTLDDLALVVSMAPTDFLGKDDSNPHGIDYAIMVAGADADVTGCGSHIAEPFHIHDRATGTRSAISLHGVGHGDFHDSLGSVAEGPCLVGKPATHALMRGWMLPLVMHHLRDNVPAEDYLWRQWEGFSPPGAPDGPCVVVDLQHRPDPLRSADVVIEDAESFVADPLKSSSGGAVTYDVLELQQGRFNDENFVFTHDGLPWNGFTMGRASDKTQGTVFSWDGSGPASIRYEVVAAGRNARPFRFLGLRAAQATRHPFTAAALEDLVFTVTLHDHLGRSASLPIDVFGGGIEEPYQRGGCGVGVGWNNEFETIRLALDDFQALGTGLDLGNLAEVELRFGPGAGSAVGRLGLDDLTLVR